jgi:hypothetical protein
LTAFCFAGFGTDRLRRAKVMKTAGRENPNRWGNASSNRAHGAEVQNRSCSIMWAGKQEKVRPLQECFFLTFLFIELIRSWDVQSRYLGSLLRRKTMNVIRDSICVGLMGCILILPLNNVAAQPQPTTPSNLSSIKQQVQQIGIGAEVKLKLAGGEKVRGNIQAMDDQGFVLGSGQQASHRRINYDK